MFSLVNRGVILSSFKGSEEIILTLKEGFEYERRTNELVRKLREKRNVSKVIETLDGIVVKVDRPTKKGFCPQWEQFAQFDVRHGFDEVRPTYTSQQVFPFGRTYKTRVKFLPSVNVYGD